MQVSIVIPVYNASGTLGRALDSILAPRNLPAIKEIILVDNGSTDKSMEIAEKYAKRFPGLVKGIRIQKRGASAARNEGAKLARGKYLWFIDADDEIAPDAVAEIWNTAAETDADIIMFSAVKTLENGEKVDLPAIPTVDLAEFKSQFIRRALGPWQIAVKRAWYIKNGFNFREGIIHEDMEMIPALILKTNNVASIDKPLYFYYYTAGSVLHQPNFDPHAFDIFPALKGVYQRFVKEGAVEKYHDELEWFFIWQLLVDAAEEFARFPEGHKGFKASRQMLRKYFPKWRKNRFLNQRKLGLKFKLRVILNYHGMVLRRAK